MLAIVAGMGAMVGSILDEKAAASVKKNSSNSSSRHSGRRNIDRRHDRGTYRERERDAMCRGDCCTYYERYLIEEDGYRR